VDANEGISQQLLARIAEYLEFEQSGDAHKALPALPDDLMRALLEAGPAALRQALTAIEAKKDEPTP